MTLADHIREGDEDKKTDEGDRDKEAVDMIPEPLDDPRLCALHSVLVAFTNKPCPRRGNAECCISIGHVPPEKEAGMPSSSWNKRRQKEGEGAARDEAHACGDG